jgi:Putative zinc-finger
MIPSCRTASELLSQGQDRPLTLPEQLRLRTHLLICKRCRRFSRHLDFLRMAIRRYRDRE